MGAVTRRSFGAAQPLGTRRHRPDYWLLVISAALIAVGLVVVYSISPGLVAEQGDAASRLIFKQLIAVGLGLVAFGITANLPLKAWERLQTPLLVAAALSAVAVRVFGQEVNG